MVVREADRPKDPDDPVPLQRVFSRSVNPIDEEGAERDSKNDTVDAPDDASVEALLELQAQHMSPQPYLTWQEAPPAGVPWQGGESAEGAVPLYGDLISPRGESSNRAAITPGDTIAASSSGTPRAGAAVGAATDSGSAKLKPKVAKQMLHSANLWPPA